MVDFEEGSIVWARSTVKDKWWPSVAFNTWEAAREAGFVPDGIAWLIEYGRKVDITDDEAQPEEGEVLNLYLGETPEWERIQHDDDHLLPFKANRQALSKQRLGGQLRHQFSPALATADAMISQQQQHQQQQRSSSSTPRAGPTSPAAAAAAVVVGKTSIAHMNPRRAGVLLDFGSGTSFASFAELWDYLRHNGWATLPGKGLASWHYFPPGSDPKMSDPVLRRDYFDSEDAVIDHVRRTGLERPAPVAASRSSPATKTRSGSGRILGKRRTPSSPATPAQPPPQPPQAPTASSAASNNLSPASKRTAPSCSGGSAAAGVSLPQRDATDSAAAAAAGAPAAERAPASGAPSPASGSAASGVRRMVAISEDAHPSGAVNGKAASNGGTAAANDGTAAATESVANGDGAAEPDEEGGGVSGSCRISSDGGEDKDDDDGELLVVEGLDDKEEPRTAGDTEAGEEEQKEARGSEGREGRLQKMEPPTVGGKRSHGRSMQVEAVHTSSSPRGAPNLAKEVMRQAVMARRHANSPPAPSPSKKPRRAGSTLAPEELARLARKQLTTLRALLDGSRRPYDKPHGVDRPVGEIVKFVKKAHSSWMISRQQPSSSGVAASPAGVANGPGAMILAGPKGVGKTTAFLAAVRKASISAANVSTTRFATIKCDTLRADDRNDVFSKVLRAVTGSKANLDGERALETLGKMSEPSPFLTVFCVEDGDEVLDQGALLNLLGLAYKSQSPFAVVYMMSSIDRAIELHFEQGCLARDCRMVHMLPCEEDRLRAILGQSLGACDKHDTDGALVAASLVNKAALDTIAKAVARACGNIRVAITVCEVALAQRLKELERCIAADAPGAAASARGGDGASSPGGSGAGSVSPSSSGPPTGSAITAPVLLTVAGAKAAINMVMQQW